MHVKQEGLDLQRIFKIFSKQSGTITYEHLQKILELVGYSLSDLDF